MGHRSNRRKGCKNLHGRKRNVSKKYKKLHGAGFWDMFRRKSSSTQETPLHPTTSVVMPEASKERIQNEFKPLIEKITIVNEKLEALNKCLTKPCLEESGTCPTKHCLEEKEMLILMHVLPRIKDFRDQFSNEYTSVIDFLVEKGYLEKKKK